ncbi:hypothetical protein [Halothiobacillus sp.]|uniref:hypothetical protein n=1 Tax=Halothiobacillus sp. TaxID=1891311 RepID=UPI002AD55F4C|nr:hypothetical protein [Halothiobacillus sp.]
MHPFKAIALSMILMSNFALSIIGAGDSVAENQAKTPGTQESPALPSHPDIKTSPHTNNTYGSKHYENPSPMAVPHAKQNQKLRYGDRVNKTSEPNPAQSN